MMMMMMMMMMMTSTILESDEDVVLMIINYHPISLGGSVVSFLHFSGSSFPSEETNRPLLSYGVV